MILERSEKFVLEAGVIHNVDNISDHEPIFSVIEVPQHEPNLDDNDVNEPTPKFDWKSASEDQRLDFNDELFRRLMDLRIPSCVQNCRNLQCQDADHISEIDSYVKDLICNIMESGDPES